MTTEPWLTGPLEGILSLSTGMEILTSLAVGASINIIQNNAE